MKHCRKNKWLNFNIFSIQIGYLALIVIISVILSIVKPTTLYIDLVIIFITAIWSIYICIVEVKTRKHRIEELSKSVDIVLKDSLDLIDIPMVIFTTPEKVIWQNKISKHLLNKETILNVALEVKNTKNVEITLQNNEVFLVISNIIKFSNYECTLLSFINKTNESKLQETLANTKVGVGIVFFDNYDETLQGLDEIQKSEITSKIVKEIREWVKENKGILNKIEKDRYIIFVDKQYIDKMEENSFEILEKVKRISDKTKLPITISIGMSYGEETLEDRYMASSSALDIALGRGGDQAVIKKDKKFDFYGGASLGLEKTSKVRSRTISQALKEIIQKSDKVYVMGHKNSDVDCIGSAIGISKISKMIGKEVHILVDGKCNASTKTIIDRMKNLKDYENVFVQGNDIKKLDFTNSLLVVVDTHKKSYLAYPDVIDEFEKVVVIDHHRRGPEFIENALLTYHEIYASSTAELVTEILMYLENITLTSIEAESLYAGIVIDTKNFIFKTGVRTFEVAAYLKRFGIDLTEVKQLFQSDFETYMAKIEIVKNAEVLENKIAISICNESYEDMPIIAAQAADELLSISGIIASFVLCKVDNVVMISGRSMGDINVQAIMETVGGGGHLTFAGAQMAGVTLDQAKEKLIDSIKNNISKE